MTEPELVSWVNLTWLTEELFTNLHDRGDSEIEGRFVPVMNPHGQVVIACNALRMIRRRAAAAG